MTEDNKDKQGTDTSLASPIKIQTKKVGLAARRAEAISTVVDADKMPNRIGIIFDDSGSMGGDKIDQAKKATKSFLQVCNPNDTAVTLHGFSPHRRYKLNTDFPSVALLAEQFEADQGTPLHTSMANMLASEPITRAVVFSDGCPTDMEGRVVTDFVEKGVPVDTIYVKEASPYQGHYEDRGREILKSIAERTGGIFMEFKDGASFAKAFKYLAPAFRAMLESAEFRDKLQKGQV